MGKQKTDIEERMEDMWYTTTRVLRYKGQCFKRLYDSLKDKVEWHRLLPKEKLAPVSMPFAAELERVFKKEEVHCNPENADQASPQPPGFLEGKMHGGGFSGASPDQGSDNPAGIEDLLESMSLEERVSMIEVSLEALCRTTVGIVRGSAAAPSCGDDGLPSRQFDEAPYVGTRLRGSIPVNEFERRACEQVSEVCATIKRIARSPYTRKEAAERLSQTLERFVGNIQDIAASIQPRDFLA